MITLKELISREESGETRNDSKLSIKIEGYFWDLIATLELKGDEHSKGLSDLLFKIFQPIMDIYHYGEIVDW
jgi:hypothetical protein